LFWNEGFLEVPFYDDDYIPLGSRAPRTLPYQISGGALIYTAYADAFIEPLKVPSEYRQTDVPFKRNLDAISYYLNWEPTVTLRRDLEDTEDLWVAYLLCAWQGSRQNDDDPDSEGDAVTGESDPGQLLVAKKNFGAVYIETIREEEGLPTTPRTGEYHTVVHEIGHQGSGAHTDGGIMGEGAHVNETQFSPVTIKRFRENRRF
jgi:hypothetical protein